MSISRAAWLLVLLYSLAVTTSADAEPAALRISSDPALPIVMQRDERNVFRVVGAKQFSLRVRTQVSGSFQDVTATCSFTPASPLVSVGDGGALSIAASASRTLAAVVVECGGAREIVGFELSPSAQ